MVWTRIKDNNMRHFGDIDYKKKVIRVNKSKKKNSYGEIIDTIIHEEKHKESPRMKEKNVRTFAEKKVKKMSEKEKRRLYGRYV